MSQHRAAWAAWRRGPPSSAPPARARRPLRHHGLPAGGRRRSGYQTRRWADEASRGPVVRCSTTTPTSHRRWPSTASPRIGASSVSCVDGTGFGADGTIWGGEVLVARTGTSKVTHLRLVPLPAATPHPPALAASPSPTCGRLGSSGRATLPGGPRGARRACGLVRQLEHGTARLRADLEHGTPLIRRGRTSADSGSATWRPTRRKGRHGAAVGGHEEALGRGTPAPPYRFGLSGGTIDRSPVLRALVAGLRRAADTGAMAAASTPRWRGSSATWRCAKRAGRPASRSSP